MLCNSNRMCMSVNFIKEKQRTKKLQALRFLISRRIVIACKIFTLFQILQASNMLIRCLIMELQEMLTSTKLQTRKVFNFLNAMNAKRVFKIFVSKRDQHL